MVKVSVVVPVYNAEEFLEECLDSVVNQTFKDIEIICVDDESSDNSLEILQNYANSDNRFKIISQHNSGSGASRNIGFKNVLGDYVYFIDADDILKETCIETFYNNAISNDSDVVVSKIARFEKDLSEIDYSLPGFDWDNYFGEVDFENFVFTYKDVKKYVLNSSFAPWMKMFRTKFLIDNNINFLENSAFDDIIVHVKSFLLAKKISFSPNFLYFYRNNINSISNTPTIGYDIFHVIDIVELFLKENNYYVDFKDEFDLFKISQIISFILSTGSEEYFQKTKSELGKIRLSDSNNIEYWILVRFNNVLGSKSLFEYLNKMHEYHMNNLKGEIANLKEKNNSLNKENSILLKKYESLNSDFMLLNEKYQKLINNNFDNNDNKSDIKKRFQKLFK